MRGSQWIASLVVGALGVGPGLAVAQSTAGMGTSNGRPPGLATNPYANPYANPFLNPYAANAIQGASADDALLFFLAARQAQAVERAPAAAAAPAQARRGPARATTTTAATGRLPAEMPDALMAPGGSASGYFNRGTTRPGGAGRYYHRHNLHFNANRR